MRVGLNARLLANPTVRGFNRYTAELARALAASERVEIVLFSERAIHERHRLHDLPSVVEAVRPHIRWQHWWLPRMLTRERIDLFHAPAHWGIPWRCPCPTVVTIHDLFGREMPHLSPRGSFGAAARHALEEALVARRARFVIAVSEWTARSVQRHLGVPRDRIAVTVEGAAPAFCHRPPPAQIDAVLNEFGLDRPYFLYVGGLDTRKNLGALVGALARTAPEGRVPVALVTDGDATGLRREATAAGVAAWLRVLGPIEDEKLAALYAGAVAVVLPSWLEGFGLPVVEAMNLGTPSIVSAAGALPESAGDAGLVVPPDDHGALAAAMQHLARDPPFRAGLASRARDRAQFYTWERAATQTLAIYERALSI